jgi:hypothetical protein
MFPAQFVRCPAIVMTTFAVPRGTVPRGDPLPLEAASDGLRLLIRVVGWLLSQGRRQSFFGAEIMGILTSARRAGLGYHVMNRPCGRSRAARDDE